MSEFIVAKFSTLSAARRASAALHGRPNAAATIHASVVLQKNLRGQISVYDRVEHRGHGPITGAFIGGLAGLGVGALAAIVSALGGALVGLTAESTKREARVKFRESVSRKVRSNDVVFLADVSAADAGAVRAMIRKLGGAILSSGKVA